MAFVAKLSYRGVYRHSKIWPRGMKLRTCSYEGWWRTPCRSFKAIWTKFRCTTWQNVNKLIGTHVIGYPDICLLKTTYISLTFLPPNDQKMTSSLLSGGPISPPNSTVTQTSLHSWENWPPIELYAAVFLSLSALFQLLSKVPDNNVKHSFSSHNICVSHVLPLVCQQNVSTDWDVG